MTTAAQLFERFLAYRERTVTARTLARDRAVLDRFHEYLDANGPAFVDELTGRRLRRADGGIGLCDLVDVEVIIMNLGAFMRESLLPDEPGGSAVALRQFVLWLHRVEEFDICCYLELHAVIGRGGRRAQQLGAADYR